MTETELLTLIRGGENIRVEFKKSTNDVTKDVYDTVCSFSNREGGIIVLGVKDNGEVLGIDPDAIDRIKKDFVTSINNGHSHEQNSTYSVFMHVCEAWQPLLSLQIYSNNQLQMV